MPRVISAVKQSQSQPDDFLAQSELISICHEVLQPCGRLVNSSRAAVPTVGDQVASMQLSNTTRSLAESLAELRAALTKVYFFPTGYDAIGHFFYSWFRSQAQETSGSMELDSAILVIRQLDEELYVYKREFLEHRLTTLPGETVQ